MLPENNDYKNMVEEIKNKVRQAQYSAMVKVNSDMFQLYWNIGKELNEQVQYGILLLTFLLKKYDWIPQK